MHRTKSSFLLLICLSISYLTQAQREPQYPIAGKILDESGEPLSFATVYVEGTTNGTTSNADGNYQLMVSEGSYNVVAQYIGYEKLIKPVTITGNVTLNFVLKPETLVLHEVVISANEKDPANGIIRKAIQKRKFYQKEVNAFSCEVYIKGLQRLDKRPDKLLGMTITVDTGIVYFSESISKLRFKQPDQINETMISSKLSGNNNAFSYNQASEMLIDLYDNNLFVEGLSERKFISPLSNNAFLYYDFKLAGTLLQDGLLINKIRVTPKRATDPVFSGHIYIIDGSWRIHSVDMMLTKANGINFVDTLHFEQIFAPVEYDIWMALSQRFTFSFNTFGFEGSGHFTAIYRNYEIEPNYDLFKKEDAFTRRFDADHEEKNLFDKKDFTKAILTVEEGANEKDSIYWKNVRPIPLSKIELRDYKVKDSIRVVKESRPYQDSVDAVRNKFKLGNLFFTGYTNFNTHEKRYIAFPTLLEAVQYNAVEGLVANMEMRITKRNEHSTNYRISPALRYGFANKQFQAKIEGIKVLNRKKYELLSGGFGRFIYQFNESNPISAFDNTFFSLISGENYARFFQKSFIYGGYQRELVNGVLFTGNMSYAYRHQLQNHTNYNFKGNSFVPNIPLSKEKSFIPFPDHQALSASVRIRYRIDQRYIDRPDRKINLKSKYPDLYLVYRKGIPWLGSDVNYDFVKIGADHEIILGLTGTSQFSVWSGIFFNNENMYFQDFEHFNGNRTYLRKDGENLFQLLDYYRYSTQDRFLEAHYEHHFNEFIFNKIPFVKRLNLQAVASVNYLATPAVKQYVELGAGIEHIFKFIRVDFYTSFRNGEHERYGFRVGAGF